MGRFRRFTAAAVMAGTIACGMVLTAARVEAKKPGGDDGQAAVCAYLLSVITYPGVSEYIKASATYLYTVYGCQPALP